MRVHNFQGLGFRATFQFSNLNGAIAAARFTAARALSSSSAGGSNFHEEEEQSAQQASPPRRDRKLTKLTSINSGFTLDANGGSASSNLHGEASATEDGLMADTPGLKAKLSHSLVGENVHDSYTAKKETDRWRHRPLFDRVGFKPSFQSGQDAAGLLLQELRRRDPYQGEFLDSVEDIVYDLAPAFEERPMRAWIFKQLMEPEYFYTFRVPWKDDNQNSRINRGFLIQYSSSLGPYNGGVIFSYNMSHGLTRMLGWEQTLRNALAGQLKTEVHGKERVQVATYGGLKCGSDFDPEEKSDDEVKRFCYSFMEKLQPLLDSNSVGSFLELDTKVGRREARYLTESFNKLTGGLRENLFQSSNTCHEFKGYGCVYFAESALKNHVGLNLSDMRCIVSGSGLFSRNVALKLIQIGAKPLTLSDDTGIIYAPEGLTEKHIETVAKFKVNNNPLSDYARTLSGHDVEFIPSQDVFRQDQIQAQVVFAAGSKSEINVDDAAALEEKEVIAVFECLDRSVTTNARVLLSDRDILFASSKSVGAGTIVASGFIKKYVEDHGVEPKYEVIDDAVKDRMCSIEREISEIAASYNMPGNLKAGANILSFLRIAENESLPPDEE